MNEFTFAMITYNQKDYVFEHLESIKFQILNFGKNININFLLCDDCSNDETVLVIKNWLAKNNKLFNNIKIFVSDKNNGIVSNVVTALKNIETENYKILAGDDIYFKNNIFEIYDNSADIYITPVIRFNKNNIINNSRWFFKELLIKDEKNINLLISESLKYSMNLESPGIFLNKSLIDNGAYLALKNYKFIDDVPLFNYLYKKNGIKTCILEKPYILYRVQSGISTNKNHIKYKRFFNEHKVLDSEIFVKKHSNKYLNWFKYKYKIMDFLYKYNLKNLNNSKIKAFRKKIEDEEREAKIYLEFISKIIANYDK